MSVFRLARYSVDIGTLATIEVGEHRADSPTLIYLHGWQDNSATFVSVMENVAEISPFTEQIAVDFPGHGYSSHRPVGDFYAFHDYLDDLHQLLTKLARKKVIFVGHSLGGFVASCYSAAFPERVVGCLQIEGFGPLSEDDSQSVSRMRNGILSRARIRNKMESASQRGYKNLEDAVSHKAQALGLSSELVKGIVERGVEQRGERYFWRHDVKLHALSVYRMSERHARNVTQYLNCPYIVMLGSQSRTYLPVDSTTQELHIPNSEFVTVDGGHHCHLEHPDVCAKLINKLIIRSH